MRQRLRGLGLVALTGVGVVSCRPSDVLSVPAPAGVIASSALQNQSGAEGVFNVAMAQLFSAADRSSGLLEQSGWLTDEFRFSGFTASYEANKANVDARVTTASRGFDEGGDGPWENLLQARSSLLLAVPGLVAYEPASGRAKIGEAYALLGYAELLVAEAYCAGTPLDQVLPGGGIQYGTPLTTDSLLGVAEGHFDSAVAEAHGDAPTAGLAGVGLGRTLLDRGQYAAAATAVASVPTSFVYNAELEPNLSAGATQGPNLYASGVDLVAGYRIFNVSDQEGENGLNFISARDPRLMLDSSMTTFDGGPWYLPTKFEVNLSLIPLATGLEAQLIEAEAALQAGQSGAWLTDLNTLRNSGCTVSGTDTTCALGTGQVAGQTVGLPSLSDPGTDSGRVSLMFRERAFWLFGTGTRLGDLRRLIRQYGRDQSTVFPTGPYAPTHQSHLPTAIPNYGTDVSLTVPTPAGAATSGIQAIETNPNYKGCIVSTKTA
jgi:hypothetical protein